jgi:hypothetical protein
MHESIPDVREDMDAHEDALDAHEDASFADAHSTSRRQPRSDQ